MPSSLSADQWRQLESLIDAVLDTPPERRAALLTKVSGGDAARRAELEQLVAACERTYPLLDQPAAERFAALIDAGPLRSEDVVADRYRVVEEIGRGGMATVYLARDIKHSRDVALKVVRAELVASLGRERFLREIEIVAQLRHPNIVPLFDSGTWDTDRGMSDGSRAHESVLYYAMPYETGQSLRDRLHRDQRLSVHDTLVVLRDVCEALAHAHSHGVVHRDIKPDNILLSGRHALVSDFGIARPASEMGGGWQSTGAGMLVGTPAYMAPELATGDPTADHRADIYAVGVLGYELLTGRTPFAGRSHHDTLAAHLAEIPIPLTRPRADVPEEVSELIMRCLAKQPAERWQTADAIVRELESLTPSISIETLGVARRRFPPRVLWALVPTVAAVAVAAVYSLRSRDAGREPPDPRLTVAILPVEAASAGGELDWIARGIQSRLSVELADVAALSVLPTPTVHALVRSNWPLERVALAHDVDYFVDAAVSKGASDSVLLSLVLIERGLRNVRVADLRLPGPPETTIETLGQELARRLRPLLGSRARELELERGAGSAEALRLRRQSDHQRLTARTLLENQQPHRAEHALDSAAALLIASERVDPEWNAPRVARASLYATRALGILQRSAGKDVAEVDRMFAASLALLDSTIRRAPRDAAALALRGRLRWQRATLVPSSALDRTAQAGLARRDLDAALAIDSALVPAVADLSRIYFEAYAKYDEAAAYAERAYRIDSFLEGASEVIHRLARSHFELGRDSVADYWCREGVRRFPANPAHVACILEVMAWGRGTANPDSAWVHYHALEQRTARGNVGARAIYGLHVASVLARARPALGDSAHAVLGRVKREAEGPPAGASRDDLLPLEAAVLFRLGDHVRASLLLAELRQRDARRVELVSRQRMLRDYVETTSPSR